MKPSVHNIIAANVKEWRKYRRMTQGQLADSVGVLRTTIANIELGYANTTIGTLYKMAKVFGCPISELLPEIDEVEV